MDDPLLVNPNGNLKLCAVVFPCVNIMVCYVVCMSANLKFCFKVCLCLINFLDLSVNLKGVCRNLSRCMFKGFSSLSVGKFKSWLHKFMSINLSLCNKDFSGLSVCNFKGLYGSLYECQFKGLRPFHLRHAIAHAHAGTHLNLFY